MVATYEELCQQHAIEPSVGQAMEVYMIGESVHDRIPEVDEHAFEVLDDLRSDFDVNVLTLGDPVIQSAKLYLTGVYQHINRARIVDEKHPDVYRDISAENPHRVHVMVGNSKKSDIGPALNIGPALKAGWHAVWLESASTWEWDDHEVELRDERLYVVSSLSEVPGVVRQIAQELDQASDLVG